MPSTTSRWTQEAFLSCRNKRTSFSFYSVTFHDLKTMMESFHDTHPLGGFIGHQLVQSIRLTNAAPRALTPGFVLWDRSLIVSFVCLKQMYMISALGLRQFPF